MRERLDADGFSILYEDSGLAKAVLSMPQAGGIVEHMVHFKETDSTNNRAKCYGAQGAPKNTLFVADRQSQGRGRRGRSWVAGSGEGLWMTLLLRPEISPDKASMLTIVSAVAVAEAIEAVIGKNAASQAAQTDVPACIIKWPNDIVMNGKKVCGILTEMSAQNGKVDYVAVGIGINTNAEKMEESIEQTATSIFLETGKITEHAKIITAFSAAFGKHYQLFVKDGDLSGLTQRYNSRLANCGKQVRILGEEYDYSAAALGIDRTGALIVEREDGSRTAVIAGEVSVRGLYGYV